jgi:hypothetical protein
MKNKNTIQSVLFQNLTNQIVKTGNIDTLNTQIHNTSVSWLDASSSIKDGRVTFVLWSQTYHVSEIMLYIEIEISTRRPIQQRCSSNYMQVLEFHSHLEKKTCLTA